MSTDLPPFRNEPVLELRRAANRAVLTGALAELDAAPPIRVPIQVAGEQRHGDALASTDPGTPSRVIAVAPVAGAQDVDDAVAAAAAAQPAWAQRPVSERAEILVRAAAHLRADRARLAALAVRECAKPWPEADADVCEAIDFLEYYARGAIALERGHPLFQVAGEHNDMRHRARGVVAVIAPWNFPLAIPTGMVAAALATGNTAVLKPAEQSPGCAAAIDEALRAAGLPRGALALLPGAGETGRALARHPGVQTIAFTGSGAVGLELLRSSAEVAPGARHLKRVVAEMGGKNCILVDADADLDDAVPGIVASAFSFSGQKCSAAGRVIAHEAIAEALLERLSGAVEVLVVGQAASFGTGVGPVIEREAQERVVGHIAEAADRGRIAAQRTGVPDDGWFVPPTVATDLPLDARVLHEEVFGPLVTVEAVRDLEEACDRVDALPYALTGGLYARSPRVVERVIRRSPVGNLYVNRPITGAMVGRQPFGGNRLSGTGTKAGGPDYLLHFTEPQVVTENTVRHGLVV